MGKRKRAMESLTEKERNCVARLVRAGMSDEVVAAEFGVSVETVRRLVELKKARDEAERRCRRADKVGVVN